LITFSPEFAAALAIQGTVNSGDAVMFSYIGLAAGDLSSGFISQAVRSRKKVVFGFILITLAVVIFYLYGPISSATGFYALRWAGNRSLTGWTFDGGHWAVGIALDR